MFGAVVLTTVFHESVQTLSFICLERKNIIGPFSSKSHVKLLSVARPSFPENRADTAQLWSEASLRLARKSPLTQLFPVRIFALGFPSHDSVVRLKVAPDLCSLTSFCSADKLVESTDELGLPHRENVLLFPPFSLTRARPEKHKGQRVCS